jgi:hypothetical protein
MDSHLYRSPARNPTSSPTQGALRQLAVHLPDATITGPDEHSTDYADDQRKIVEMRLWLAADRRKQARLHAVS